MMGGWPSSSSWTWVLTVRIVVDVLKIRARPAAPAAPASRLAGRRRRGPAERARLDAHAGGDGERAAAGGGRPRPPRGHAGPGAAAGGAHGGRGPGSAADAPAPGS